jgi:hypothetical protein
MKLFKKIYDLFTDHPYDVGETYFQHMGESLSIAARMYCCFVAQTIHAIFPFITPPGGTDVATMEIFCHNHTPEERKRRKNRITIKEHDTTYK